MNLTPPSIVLPLALGLGVVSTGWSQFTGNTSFAYPNTFNDAITGNNKFFEDGTGDPYWYVSSGPSGTDPTSQSPADVYNMELYERPTDQTYEDITDANGLVTRFANAKHYQNIDIVSVMSGADSQYAYLKINLFGTGVEDSGGVSSEGLAYNYGVRLSTSSNGNGGFYIGVNSPKDIGSTYTPTKSFAHFDTNNDVGGPGGLMTINEFNDAGPLNGYELPVVADGELQQDFNGFLEEAEVVFARRNGAMVEIAFEYAAFGFTQNEIETLGFVNFIADKGNQSPANMLNNDAYDEAGAGSPYKNLPSAAFGDTGLGNVYQIDTIKGPGAFTVIPEPSTYALMFGAAALGFAVYRRHNVRKAAKA